MNLYINIISKCETRHKFIFSRIIHKYAIRSRGRVDEEAQNPFYPIFISTTLYAKPWSS